MAEQGFNRQQRRRLKKQQKTALAKARMALDPEQIVSKYPMRLQDAAVLRDYFAGKVSHDQAREAFLASLRDPSWMMRWFAEHFDNVSPIVEWVRGPARNLRAQLTHNAETMREAVERLNTLRQQMRDLGAHEDTIPDIPSVNPRPSR